MATAAKKVTKSRVLVNKVSSTKVSARKLSEKSVVSKTATPKKAQKSTTKPAAEKVTNKTTLAVVKKVQLKSSYKELAAEWEIAESNKEQVIRNWARRLVETKRKMLQVNEQYKKLMLSFLQEAYAVYVEIENSEYYDEFYANVRFQLREEGVKIQSNTPNAGLVIRFICGAEIATKTISDYSRVLEGAKRNEIKSANFFEWVKGKTMTKVIEAERAAVNEVETYADRLKRARLVVLRVLEARETKPIISQKTTAWAAEKMMGREGLWLAIGNARRRYDRESFYADINLVAMLTPNIDIEIYIVNQLAKPFVANVEKYENLINEFEENIWADELWEKLVSAGDEESKKADMWWANKQQASRFEDEGEFRNFIKKERK